MTAIRPMAVILCEGFHDRAFWAGCAEHVLGCVDLRESARVDDWGETTSSLGKGQFAYQTPSPRLTQLRIVPFHGESKLHDALRALLATRRTKPLSNLLVHVDADTFSGDRTAALQSIGHALGSEGAVTERDGVWELDGPQTRVHGVVSWLDQAPRDGVPGQQSLERVVCAALAAAYPDRARHVAAWLRDRPNAPSRHVHKSHAWSYMAGWCPDEGCEYFLRALWSDESVVPHLIAGFRDSNALHALREITGRELA